MVKYHPLKTGTYTVSSGYGPRWGTFHAGSDFAAPIGTPIYAPCDGVVVQGKERPQGSVSGFGSWIWLDCQESAGVDLIFGHVTHGGILVKAGDRVKAGQLIGHTGNEGQSTGPHVHVEVWGAPGRLGGAHQDPAVWLSDAQSVGNAATAKPEENKESGKVSTIFGVDVSEHQNGMSLTQAAKEGIQFAIIRTTDGTYKDSVYHSHLADAESAGLVTAAYHYLRSPREGTTVAQQVAASVAVMGDKKRPVWIDCETHAGLTTEDIRVCVREYKARGVYVPGVYTYVPFWEGQMVPADPDPKEFGAMWVAAYNTDPSGTPKSIYPGDNAKQWSYPLGDRLPVMWQFGSKAQVAGYSVDINAFKGSKAQIRDLFYGTNTSEEDDMTPEQAKQLKEVHYQLLNKWGQLGNKTLVDAVADVRKDVRIIADQQVGFARDEKGPLFTGWSAEGLRRRIAEKDEAGTGLTEREAIQAIQDSLAAIEEIFNNAKKGN